MGEVYLAEDTRLGRKVALKVLSEKYLGNEERLRRFEREARAASALNHPNILTIFDVGSSDGHYFIATEYIEGRTLRQRMASGSIPLGETINIILQVARALHTAHRAGIVHLDIKPDNVMIREDGYVKLLDFGIAEFTEPEFVDVDAETVTNLLMTEEGIIKGTPRYMSPEQIRGLALDWRSDIFSLGVMMYEMLAGRPPFRAPTLSDLIVEILDREPKKLQQLSPDLPARVCQIIESMLVKDREKRLQSLDLLIQDLEAIRLQIEVEHSNPMLLERIHPPSNSSVVDTITISLRKPSYSSLIVASLVLLLSLIAGALFYQFTHRNTSTRRLAVLPLHNLKPNPETDFLSLSLADTIITKLSFVEHLIVRPTSAIAHYRGNTPDLQQAGQELAVDSLLTGSYLKEGDSLKVNLQLRDLKEDRVLWNESLELSYRNISTLQTTIADSVVSSLRIKLSRPETERIKRDVPASPEAYEFLLRGLALNGRSEYQLAMKMVEKSVELDPNYAPAWAHLGLIYNNIATQYHGGATYYEKAHKAYNRALALNPDLLNAKLFLANLLTDTNRVEESLLLLKPVVSSRPYEAQLHWQISYTYRYAGLLEESISAGEKALSIDPTVSGHAFNSYLYIGEYKKFLDSIQGRESGFHGFYRGLAKLYLKEAEEAAKEFSASYELDKASVFTNIGKALEHSIRKEPRQGLELLASLEKRLSEEGVMDGEISYKIAQAYAQLNDTEAGLRMLRKSVSQGFFCYPYIASDPLIDSLRGHKDYTTVLDEAHKRHEAFKRLDASLR